MATSDPPAQPQAAAATAAAPAPGTTISSSSNNNDNNDSSISISISIGGGGVGGSNSGSTAPPPDPDIDLVTQLQVCLGQLTTQFYASVNYISTRHPLSAPTTTTTAPFSYSSTSPSPSAAAAGAATATAGAGPGMPNGILNGNGAHLGAHAVAGAATASAASAWVDPTINPVTGLDPDNETAPPPPADPAHAPVPAAEFAAALRELAQDLVTKTRQIEALALKLPDLGDGSSGGSSSNNDAGGEGENDGRGGVEGETARQEREIAEAAAELEALSAQVGEARRRREAARERIEAVVQGWGGGG